MFLEKNPPKKLIVSPTSMNFYWGNFGFNYLPVWDDVHIYDQDKRKIYFTCIMAKWAFEDMDREYDTEYAKNFIVAVDRYMADDQIHYWYYYDEPTEKVIDQVWFEAPRNEHGLKPRSLEIWIADDVLSVNATHQAIVDFADKHWALPDIQIDFEGLNDLEEMWESYKDMMKREGDEIPSSFSYSPVQISNFASWWQVGPEKAWERLVKAGINPVLAKE